MNPQTKAMIEDRINAISRELGLLEPSDLLSGKSAEMHDLQEIEELYAERERLLQELEQLAA